MVLLTFSPARLLPHSYSEILAETWLYKKIYKTEMKFWAVLGRRGCREKTLQTAISMQLFEVVFSTFCGQKHNLNLFFKYFSIRTKKLHNKKLSNI